MRVAVLELMSSAGHCWLFCSHPLEKLKSGTWVKGWKDLDWSLEWNCLTCLTLLSLEGTNSQHSKTFYIASKDSSSCGHWSALFSMKYEHMIVYIFKYHRNSISFFVIILAFRETIKEKVWCRQRLFVEIMREALDILFVWLFPL